MAVEMLVSPIVGRLVSLAGDAIAGQLRGAWGLEENLERLQQLLQQIQSVLADAEEKQNVRQAVKTWLGALKKVAYKAEDVLDELNYEALRHKAAEVVAGDDKTPCSGKVCHDFFSSHNPLLIRLKMGRKLNKLLEEIDRIAADSTKFNFAHAQPESAAAPVDINETCSSVEESEVVGRHGRKDEIVKMLLIDNNNGDADAENVAVLPIVGMGGLGKTTMAQLIYNDQRVVAYFQLRAWVCVSDPWNAKRIIQEILSLATDEMCDSSSMEKLHLALRKALVQKRFLIVLDDVWEEDHSKWNALKEHLNWGGRGSAVIVTTRSDRVSEITGTLPSCHLSYLSEDESWELFSKRAFAPRDEQPEELVEIGKAIVNKCGGLPLAIKMLGSLLYMQRDTSQWLSIKESDMWNIQADILPALRLSYKHLPLHSKQCFTFCATFPKDHEMDKETLIHMWMAHGFIPSQGGGSLEAKGHGIFKQLAQRSFLQDIKEKLAYEFVRTTCRMHDLVHDLALSIAGNDCAAIQEESSKNALIKDAYHLFFPKSYELDIKHTLNASPNLRTILMIENDRGSPNLLGLTSTCLRVLALSGSNFRLPSTMKCLQNLRYLQLWNPELSELPESICTLLNLQTLDLSGCWRLQRLPERMACMISLRHLYLDGCDELMMMPPGMGRMTDLQTLTLYVVSEESGRGIGEIEKLHLSSRLQLRNLECVKDAEEARKLNLHTKDLTLLSLSWGNKWLSRVKFSRGEMTSNVEEQVLEELKPPGCLKRLEIRYYHGLNFPIWMAGLQNLKGLHLLRCRGLHQLPPLWQLRSLEELSLIEMDNLKYIISDNTATTAEEDTTGKAFHSLKTLKLLGLEKLEEWSQWETKNAPQQEAVPNCFPALVDLEIAGCPELAGPIPLAPCLKSLQVSGSPKIPLGSISALTSLVSLEINNFRSQEEGRSTSVADDSIVIVPRGTVALRNLQCLEQLSIGGPREIRLVWWLHEDEEDEKEEEEEEEGSGHSSSLKLKDLSLGRCDWIFWWPRYSWFWTSLASLEILRIYHCDALLALPCQGLKSLRLLLIDECPRLKSLALEGLTALRRLILEDCTDLASLWPQQVLVNLEELTVSGCPQLEEKCKTGGEYWSLISNIPDLDIFSRISE